MNVKGCIFDLDGVIVDTAKYHFLAWRRIADELGFDFTEKDNERLKGVSRMASLDILLEVGGIASLTDDEKLSLAGRKNAIYVEMIDSMTPAEILPGALDFLRLLRSNGVKTALGSASKNARRILGRLDIEPLFDAIVDGTVVSRPKPDPEVFLTGAHLLGLAPTDCVVFEDAAAGVQAAKAGGMRCVGIGTAENLPQADIVVGGLAQMDLQKLQTI